jgi:dephospho-CoA kinase
MASQPSRREWLAVADHVIDNSGNLGDVASRVADLVSRLCHPVE